MLSLRLLRGECFSLITSEQASQRVWKVLFTCVVYIKLGYEEAQGKSPRKKKNSDSTTKPHENPEY